jgi:cobyrinic acid a,c-diamide synthase
VIAGVTSGVGKTIVAAGVMHAMRVKKGLSVQPFKVGPDFIDPSYHTFITERQSRNLDVWLMGKRGILDCFAEATKDADIAVIEGVMGLFDGISGKDNFASTAHVAKILDAPIVLVVDGGRGGRSIAAIVLGFLRFDRRVKIAGIIINNVAGARHAGYISEALEGKVKAPVVGIIRRQSEIKLEERHMGLVPTLELKYSKQKAIIEAAKFVSDQIDIDKVLDLCAASTSLVPSVHRHSESRIRIAVALDHSFNFYYADNLDALRRRGANLVFFSPVKQNRLPENIHGIIIGGGFPEVLADRLEKNRSMIDSIRKAVQDNALVYGECGGLMYLTRSIRGFNGEKKSRKMIGLIDADTLMTGRLTLNYSEAECRGPIFGSTRLRGHEFHYSSIENIAGDCRFAYSMKRGNGVVDAKDGFIVSETGLAAYMHLHFSNHRIADKIVQTCAKYSRK